jgi:putative FmdB family regulatory protein
MPIYEYKCQQCGLHFEKRQSVSDAPLSVLREMPRQTRKAVVAVRFQFKGAGWYVTDYAGKKADKGEKSSSANQPQSPTPHQKARTIANLLQRTACPNPLKNDSRK